MYQYSIWVTALIFTSTTTRHHMLGLPEDLPELLHPRPPSWRQHTSLNRKGQCQCAGCESQHVDLCSWRMLPFQQDDVPPTRGRLTRCLRHTRWRTESFMANQQQGKKCTEGKKHREKKKCSEEKVERRKEV